MLLALALLAVPAAISAQQQEKEKHAVTPDGNVRLHTEKFNRTYRVLTTTARFAVDKARHPL